MNQFIVWLLVTLYLLSLPSGPVQAQISADSQQQGVVTLNSLVDELLTKNPELQALRKLDIQQLGLVGDQKISVVIYEDRKLQFGKDRIFNQLPVKHQHGFGGWQGALEIGEKQVVYRTSHSSDSRI